MTATPFMTVSADPLAAPTLPDDYRPPASLNLCGNFLAQVQVPILFRGVPLLLIGDGVLPLVWLAGRTDPKGEQWRWIVEKSVARSNFVRVDVRVQADGEVEVFAQKHRMVGVKRLSEGNMEVTHLDLRPIGIGLEGTSSGISIGGKRISGNHFTGGRAAIALA